MEIFDPSEFSDHCSLYVSMCYTECHNEEAEKFTDKIFWDKEKAASLLENLYDKRQSFDELISNELDKRSDINSCVQGLTGLMYVFNFW